jgi:hypothetical protein
MQYPYQVFEYSDFKEVNLLLIVLIAKLVFAQFAHDCRLADLQGLGHFSG